MAHFLMDLPSNLVKTTESGRSASNSEPGIIRKLLVLRKAFVRFSGAKVLDGRCDEYVDVSLHAPSRSAITADSDLMRKAPPGAMDF